MNIKREENIYTKTMADNKRKTILIQQHNNALGL